MIPNNEQSTIVLFAKLAKEMGYTFREIGTHCPDAILEKDGQPVRVEFEHKAKTFRTHKHDPAAVDLIICWEDDWPHAPVPVLALEKYTALAEIKEDPKLSFHERFSTWRERRRQRRYNKKNACPICETVMIVSCGQVEWTEDDYEYYQWVNKRCPKCNYYQGRIAR